MNESVSPPVAPAAGERFPDAVVEALHHAGLTLTAMPVRIEDGQWQTAFFYVLAPEAPGFSDGRLVPGPFAVELEADLHERPEATVVEIGVQIGSSAGQFGGTMLLLTGHSAAHFEVLKLLSTQADLPLFIGDPFCRVLWRQRVVLEDGVRAAFRELLDEAVARDAMIRLSARYDPDAAFAAVLAGRGV